MSTSQPQPTSFVAWHPEIVPGEPFRVPAQWVIPCADGFWTHALRVTEGPTDPRFGDWGCLMTYALEPAEEHVGRHWAYGATAGQSHVWHDTDTGVSVHERYLGRYRILGLMPNGWATGTLSFVPESD